MPQCLIPLRRSSVQSLSLGLLSYAHLASRPFRAATPAASRLQRFLSHFCAPVSLQLFYGAHSSSHLFQPDPLSAPPDITPSPYPAGLPLPAQSQHPSSPSISRGPLAHRPGERDSYLESDSCHLSSCRPALERPGMTSGLAGI